MLKTIIASLVFASSAYALPTIPDGQYEGKARWRDSAGGVGLYTDAVTVKGDDILANYTYSTGTASYNLHTQDKANGFFDVIVGNKKVGEGYCLTVQCHYNAEIDGAKLEEALTFWQGHLYRVGSKTVNGVNVAWEEALEAK